MSVLSSRALQDQLSIIMAALTKAAVAEICELVDEGYAVLQMEISRSHKENQDLRKKLHLIESIVVRGERAAATAAASVEEEEEEEAEVEAAMTEEAAPQQPGTVEPQRDGSGQEAAGGAAEVEFPDVVLIKDEDSDNEEPAKTPSDGASVQDGVRSRRMKRRWPGNEDPEKSSPSEQLVQKTSTKKTASLYSLDSAGSEPGRPVQIRDEAEAGDSVCSYSSQVDPDVQLVQECPLVPPGSARSMFFSGGALIESPSARAELDLDLGLDPSWSTQTKARTSFAQFHQSETAEAFGLKLVSVSGSAPADCGDASEGGGGGGAAFDFEDGDVVMNLALYREQSGGRGGAGGGFPRGKRFICSVCNRTYATTQNLEVHMRIHTGERPFSCSQCGKKFTQSAHLKSHMSIHTGERPYSCAVCARSFIVKYSLKLHMKKCHPNVL